MTGTSLELNLHHQFKSAMFLEQSQYLDMIKLGCKIIGLLLVLKLLSAEPLQLFMATTSLNEGQAALSGSVAGGTTLYISGLGFGTDPDAIQVYVGDFPCKIPADGLNSNYLMCITGDSGSTTDLNNLPIKVIKSSSPSFVPNSQYSYKSSETPVLYRVVPGTGFAGDELNYYGYHRIYHDTTDMLNGGDIIKLQVGDEICNIFDYVQDRISPNSFARIRCRQSTTHQAGKYQINEQVVPGVARKKWSMARTSFTNQNYEHVVLPAVEDVTPDSGFESGQDITIKGSGFSFVKARESVQVDGVNCAISSTSPSEIKCRLQPKQASDSALLESNASSQIGGYIGGSGFRYTKYDISQLGSKTHSGLKEAVESNANTISETEQGVVGELYLPNLSGMMGIQLSGYFYAPVAGSYIFRGAADDNFGLYISEDFGSATVSNTPYIYDGYSQYADNYYLKNSSSALGTGIEFEAQKYYFMKLYYINNGGIGYLKVSVEVPNTDTTLKWQTHQVNQLQLTFTNDPEIRQFVLEGNNMSGTFNLSIVRYSSPYDLLPSYSKEVEVKYNATESQFRNALSSFDSFSGNQISVDLQVFDAEDNATTTDQGFKYVWTVTIQKLRSETFVDQKFTFKSQNLNGTDIDFTEETIHEHAGVIQGTYTLSIGDDPVQIYDSATSAFTNPNIPFNCNENTLEAALASVGIPEAQVNRMGDCFYGCKYIISYFKYDMDVPDLVLSGSGLLGGLQGTTPQVSFFETRKYSANLWFNPVDETFLRTAEDSPAVIVTVNEIQSACKGSCSYSFINNTPEIMSQSLSGNTVSITISNPASANYDISTLDVSVGGQECTINAGGLFTSFTCDLPTNADGSPVLEAGSHNVQVNIQESGLVKIQPGVNAIEYPLSLNALTPNQGGSNGGYQIVISGNGFPSLKDEVTVQLCGKTQIITAISNTETKIIAPQCAVGTQQLSYQYNGLSQVFNFQFETSLVSSSLTLISPQSANPALKGVMEISGSGFGTDSSVVSIHLANSTGKVYQMKIISITDSLIRCGIPGGLPGNFDVKVSIEGQGDITPSSDTADDFVYEVVITSVSPASGAYYGGTLVTISGHNFSPDIRQNLVYVGDEINWLCTIESITASQIICRMPKYNAHWTQNTQNIIVGSRLIVDSTCQSDCSFTYNPDDSSPSLTSVSNQSPMSGNNQITLAGANFDATADYETEAKVVFQNWITKEVTQIVPISVTANQCTVNVPSVESGPYLVRYRIDPIGETNSIEVTVRAKFSPSNFVGSIEGGSMVLTGFGLPNGWPSTLFSLSAVSGTVVHEIDVISAEPERLEIRVPKGFDNKEYNIQMTNPNLESDSASFTQTTGATPAATLQTASPASAGSISITLQRTALQSQLPDNLYYYNVLNPNKLNEVTPISENGNNVLGDQTLPAGKYGFKLWYADKGWAKITGELEVNSPSTFTVPASTISSFAGGQLTVTGESISPQAIIKVGGFIGKAISVGPTSAIFQIPPLITPLVAQTYSSLSKTQELVADSWISDGGEDPWAVGDSLHSTIYSSNNTECFIGLDIGAGRVANIKRIRYFPNSKWTIAAKFIKGAVFEASNDGVTYTEIHVIDQTVHAGYNSFLVTTTSNYRYTRLRHGTESGCKLAQLHVYGVLYNDLNVNSLTSFSTDVVFDDGYTQHTWSDAIEYRQDATSVISSVDPETGSVKGGQTITLSGTNLGNADIRIDGVVCDVQNSSPTSITCITGSRTASLPDENSFEVSINGNKAVIEQGFEYVMRWSDVDTWGTDLQPVEGDLVYVPKGMTLLVDQSTPRLQGIVVEQGKLLFADEGPMEIHTNMITINRGQFRAGTQTKPYQNQLTFILYGGYYGKQMPKFGNKFIGCLQCKFSMHGEVRTKTWTTLQTTIDPGDTTFTVQDSVDWRVNEKIVIASTDFDHNHAEPKKIVSITSNNTITVDSPFIYEHLGVTQTYDGKNLPMRAEVGLLSRNIKMMGSEDSVEGQYGSHLMMAGSAENGMISHIAYSQFTHCGQPRIVGRYCIHFHMNGDVTESYVKGNSVHESFARIITLHAIQYLKVSENVGYRVKGHNFFIEDGIETQNVIEYNLAISSLATFNMMQTDISVASYWVTNPTNHLRYNRAAGGDFYAYWYQIKEHPDGPSARNDVCPIGNPLGESHDNIAHSYVRFGLRIFKMYAREIPCDPVRNDWLEDPWSANPSVQGRFYNYVTYRIGEAGLLGEQVGNLIFENFTVADCGRAGIEFYVANFTKEPVIARDMVIVGVSAASSGNHDMLNKGRGVITPRSSGFRVENIRFFNFGSGMTVFETCSHCSSSLLYTNVAHQYFISQLQFTNITGSYLKFGGLKRQIIYDTDGSFCNAFDATDRPSATLVSNYKHIAAEAACIQATTPNDWDNAIMCDNTVTIRRVMFTNPQPLSIFKSVSIKVQLLNNITEEVAENSTSYTSIKSLFGSMEPKNKQYAWDLPYVTGRVYNVWWHSGIDFTHMAMDISQLYQESEPAVIFKFNYTENRELFEIGHLVNNRRAGTFISKTNSLDSASCGFGNYTHDNDERVMTLCASARNKTRQFQYLDINGIKCRHICPADPGEFTKQNFVRVWSNATQWPGGVMPQPGDNVSIHGNWTILMDMNPEPMGFFLVDGDVIIPDDQPDIHIIANIIWIRAGSIKAGEQNSPFPGTITIELRGNKTDRTYTVDPSLSGNKMLVVTGKLHLYGQIPATTWTRLVQTAAAGDSQIQVQSASGWAVGDQIVVAPSYSSASQHELMTISEISGNTLTLDGTLSYSHYGSSSLTIDNSYGTLDTRTAVGLLSRKIKIVSGQDSGWGFRLIAYGYVHGTIIRIGNVVMKGVEFREGGQYDTEYSAVNFKRAVSRLTSQIVSSSFYNCKSYCLYVQGSINLNVNHNVFYLGRINHARILSAQNFNFKSNLMVAAIARPTLPGAQSDLIACYANWEEADNTVSVTDNVCQGSDIHGFAIGFSKCESTYDPYVNNIASSAKVGFIYEKINSNCVKASGVKAFACSIGQICSPPGTQQLKLDKFIIADCGRGATLRFGKEGDDQTAFFTNSYVTAVSRPNCAQCYGNGAIDCTNNFALRMLAVTINGERMPQKFGPGFDVICKQQSYDAKAFMENVTFDSFRSTYQNLPQCRNNVVFKPHPIASDMTGSSNLYTTSCINCESTAWAYFTPPDPSNFGWGGGCGNLLCTGKNNYLVHDYTGDFLGQPGILIPNNSVIGQASQNCTFIPSINGHHCVRQDFGVIEYESIAPDFNTRIMWPVYLSYEGGSWNTTTNGWRQWQWQGNEPLNKRLGRFVSIVELSRVYNMTFESQPPIDMRLQFQRRTHTGNNSQFIIIKLHYPRPNSIRVQNRGVTIKPITLRDNSQEPDLDPSVCGSNIYFYEKYMIHFVLTGDPNCKVRVSLTNSIRLTLRFEMDIDDFYNIDGPTKFIDRVCAVLSITDTSRLKIVGVYSGSVIVHAYIDENPTNVENAHLHDNVATAVQMKTLQQSLNNLNTNGTLNQSFVSVGFGSLIDFKTELFTHENQEQQAQIIGSNTVVLIVGIAVGLIMLSVFSIAGILYVARKRAKVEQVSGEEQSQKNRIGLQTTLEDNNSMMDFRNRKSRQAIL